MGDRAEDTVMGDTLVDGLTLGPRLLYLRVVNIVVRTL